MDSVHFWDPHAPSLLRDLISRAKNIDDSVRPQEVLAKGLN